MRYEVNAVMPVTLANTNGLIISQHLNLFVYTIPEISCACGVNRQVRIHVELLGRLLFLLAGLYFARMPAAGHQPHSAGHSDSHAMAVRMAIMVAVPGQF